MSFPTFGSNDVAGILNEVLRRLAVLAPGLGIPTTKEGAITLLTGLLISAQQDLYAHAPAAKRQVIRNAVARMAREAAARIPE